MYTVDPGATSTILPSSTARAALLEEEHLVRGLVLVLRNAGPRVEFLDAEGHRVRSAARIDLHDDAAVRAHEDLALLRPEHVTARDRAASGWVVDVRGPSGVEESAVRRHATSPHPTLVAAITA
jgi:hypothetical protein